MPCRCDYMDPTSLEIELSRVLLLIEETITGVPVNAKSSGWQGHVLGVYGGDDLKARTDTATAQLCEILTNCSDVTVYSLELQMWWRDHQIADKNRVD